MAVNNTLTYSWIRSNYIPVVEWQANSKQAALSLPDWLSATYVDLYDNIAQFTQYQVTDMELGQPDLISYNVYGNEQYDWLIMNANGIVDPYNDMFSGQVIRIPDLQQALAYLKQHTGPNVTNNLNQMVTV